MKDPEEKSLSYSNLYYFEENFGKYLKNRITSPLSIIGLIFIFFFITVAIFAPIIAPFDETFGIYPGSWVLPSKEHPFGTAEMGRDLLRLIIWGIRDALFYASSSTIVGLIGALMLGRVISIPHKFYFSTELDISWTLVFYVNFTIFLVFFFSNIPFYLFGLFLIPIFLTKLKKPPFKENYFKLQIKKGVIYALFVFIYSLLTYELSNMFFPSSSIVTKTEFALGTIIYDHRHPISESWHVVIFPLITIFFLILGFLLFYHGIKAKGMFKDYRVIEEIKFTEMS
jgi:ABC-type dipeptide/oligopeptide/nickel transport system permease subunit